MANQYAITNCNNATRLRGRRKWVLGAERVRCWVWGVGADSRGPWAGRFGRTVWRSIVSIPTVFVAAEMNQTPEGWELQKEVALVTVPFVCCFDSQLLTALSFKLDFLEMSKMREMGTAIKAVKELLPMDRRVKPFPAAASRTQCRSPCSRCLSMQNCPEWSNADLRDQNFCKIFGALKSIPCLGRPSRLGGKSSSL